MSSNNNEIEHCTLDEYISEHHSQEEMRNVFLNMDVALKYIHNHGYCIEVFHPSRIEVLNDMSDHIQFDNLMKLPDDPQERKDIIQEDIFNSSLIQIAFYTNIGDYLKPEFLRENFDKMILFLPEGDVAYYRGVIERGASVYFSEYALEKRNRDLKQLNQELGELDGSHDIIEDHLEEAFSNDKINDKIYKQINGLKDRAFISILMLPTLILIGLLLFALFGWIQSVIS